MSKFDGNNATDTLVSRILEELRADPEAKWKLFNALLSDEMKQLPSRVNKLQDDMDELKTDMTEVKSDIREMKGDIRELKISNAEMKGDNLEFKLGVRAKSYVCQWLGLQDPVMLSSYVDYLSNELHTAVSKAKQEGRISERQEQRIVATDVIMRAKLRSDKSPVCIAIEASYTIDASDIDRAKESADALLIVTGLPTMPVAAGYHISDLTRRYAEERGVEVRIVSS